MLDALDGRNFGDTHCVEVETNKNACFTRILQLLQANM